jgi:hypothetical protein
VIALALALSLQPPMLLRVEQPSVVYAPDGQRISLPAGTELDLCAQDGALVVYDIPSMTLRAPKPCPERPLFADGFED